MEAFAQYGVAGLAIGAVLAAIRFAEHVYEKRNGNSRLVCPNKIDDLWPALRAIDSIVRRTERSANAAEAGIKRLLDDHMETLVELQTRSTKALESLVNMQLRDHE